MEIRGIVHDGHGTLIKQIVNRVSHFSNAELYLEKVTKFFT